MKGIYHCAKLHRIPEANLKYNDIEPYPGIDICYDACKVNLEPYDYIIATPPCNYYSRANYRRETSIVAQQTKHILPTLLNKCIELGKPFLIENVLNSTLLPKSNQYEFEFNQHHFYTNIFIFKPDKSYEKKQDKQHLSYGYRDNNEAVDLIIKTFLETIGAI